MEPAESAATSFNDGQLRPAIAADVKGLVNLINAAFVVEQIAIEGDRVDGAAVEKYMQAGEFLILEEKGSPLGCVYVQKRDDRGYLGLLSVDPTQRKRGIGRRLGTAAEKYLRQQACVAVDLRVISARAELLSFYEKLGYSVTGTSAMPPDAPLKIPCHFIHMSKSLT